jgi:hypothetical protein
MRRLLRRERQLVVAPRICDGVIARHVTIGTANIHDGAIARNPFRVPLSARFRHHRDTALRLPHCRHVCAGSITRERARLVLFDLRVHVQKGLVQILIKTRKGLRALSSTVTTVVARTSKHTHIPAQKKMASNGANPAVILRPEAVIINKTVPMNEATRALFDDLSVSVSKNAASNVKNNRIFVNVGSGGRAVYVQWATDAEPTAVNFDFASGVARNIKNGKPDAKPSSLGFAVPIASVAADNMRLFLDVLNAKTCAAVDALPSEEFAKRNEDFLVKSPAYESTQYGTYSLDVVVDPAKSEHPIEAIGKGEYGTAVFELSWVALEVKKTPAGKWRPESIKARFAVRLLRYSKPLAEKTGASNLLLANMLGVTGDGGPAPTDAHATQCAQSLAQLSARALELSQAYEALQADDGAGAETDSTELLDPPATQGGKRARGDDELSDGEGVPEAKRARA